MGGYHYPIQGSKLQTFDPKTSGLNIWWWLLSHSSIEVEPTVVTHSETHANTSINGGSRLIIADCRGQTKTAGASGARIGVAAAPKRRLPACATDVLCRPPCSVGVPSGELPTALGAAILIAERPVGQ